MKRSGRIALALRWLKSASKWRQRTSLEADPAIKWRWPQADIAIGPLLFLDASDRQNLTHSRIEGDSRVETLWAILLMTMVVWLIRLLNRSRSGWNSAKMWAQQFDVAHAWLGQCAKTGQQVEMICAPAPLGFDADEQVVFVLPDVDLLEPRAVRRSRSYHGGPTIRLAKGLSLRLGAGVSQSESQDELRNIDRGTFVLTTKRLAFMGSLRTTNVSLNDIVGIQGYSDAILVHRERKERAESYRLSQPIQIPGGSGQGLTVFGPMMVSAIQLAKAYYENPRGLALLRQQAGTLKSPYREYQADACPLQYGSLYHSSTDPQPQPQPTP